MVWVPFAAWMWEMSTAYANMTGHMGSLTGVQAVHPRVCHIVALGHLYDQCFVHLFEEKRRGVLHEGDPVREEGYGRAREDACGRHAGENFVVHILFHADGDLI